MKLLRSLTQCKACLRNLARNGSLRSFSDKALEEPEWPRRVVSGIQPTGELHVGNYFGAVQRCVRLQDRGDHLTLFIADLHSLTMHQMIFIKMKHDTHNTTYESSAKRRKEGAGPARAARALDACALLLAAGVRPERAVLFQQSAVPRHAELCWLLVCVATQARLQQLPQYRERAGGGGDAVPLGLLLYPVLQAADVLLHGATHVPVGRDQLQHLQLAAQLARALARRHGLALPVPRALLAEDGSDRVLSLRDPSRKMSKSDPDPKSRILLADSEREIRLKVRKAVTDCEPRVTYAPETRPGVSNLVAIHCLCAGLVPEEAVAAAEGLTTAQYKEVVADALCAHLAPLRARYEAWRARPARLRDVLRHGAARARLAADRTWARVARAAGLHR